MNMQWQIDIDSGVLTLDGRPVATLSTGSGSNDDWRDATRLGTEMANALNAWPTHKNIKRDNEALQCQLADKHKHVEYLARLLHGIHDLLYPAALSHEGRTYHFRPENPHEFMQALSDRIRALPDEINRI